MRVLSGSVAIGTLPYLLDSNLFCKCHRQRLVARILVPTATTSAIARTHDLWMLYHASCVCSVPRSPVQRAHFFPDSRACRSQLSSPHFSFCRYPAQIEINTRRFISSRYRPVPPVPPPLIAATLRAGPFYRALKLTQALCAYTP